MAIENLLDWATIQFPRSLDEHDLEQLFTYTAQHLPGFVDYHLDIGKRIDGNVFHAYSPSSYFNKKTLSLSVNSLSVNGAIFSYQPYEHASFSSTQDKDDPMKITSIIFSTISGYERDEHRKGFVEFIETVKHQAMRYFSQ